ncbi:hypothetical protein GCM10010266_73770 [Streptomyces griseomycini]|nr:hypothetical protein GCM10010266_73770 [Streptomyces griseomycini]GGR62127.1 hypothetical protein GCM10015536_77420 [Streptomyces griseomycini]
MAQEVHPRCLAAVGGTAVRILRKARHGQVVRVARRRARLRRESRRLRKDVEILKRATAFFATETR